MSELRFHFLSTGQQPSMLVEHPNKTILFDIPTDLPVEPDVLFLTQRSEEIIKKAQEFAEVFNIPVMGAGKLSTEGFEIEPFQVAKKAHNEYEKAYGYMIKSCGINVGYVPFATDFPRELLGADVVIMSGDNSNHTVAMAKSAGISRIYLIGLTDEMRKSSFPTGVTKLSDGQVLSLVEKTHQVHKESVNYREPQGEEEGDCGSCRFFVPSSTVSEAAFSKTNTTLAAIAEARIHRAYTEAMDDLREMGHLSRDERIGLSKAITDALEAFTARIAEMGLDSRVVPAEDVAVMSKSVDVKPNEIRVRVRPVDDFQADSFRTISISASKGIRAVIGRPRGQETTRVQSYRFDKGKWDSTSAAAWVRSKGETPKSAIGTCKLVIGDIDSEYTCDLFEPRTLAPFSKSTQQAFGSPGGKRAIAKKIAAMIPQHSTFVECYAGGAAVFFAKDPSEREVLNDLDVDIAQTYKDLQTVDDGEVRKIQRMDWTISKDRFNQLKKSTAAGRTGRLYRFLYMRGSAYGNYTQPSASHEGKVMKVASRLPQIRDRLKGVVIANRDAVDIIQKFDGPETFFYLDPPYPTEWKWDEGGHGGRASSDEWGGKDLHRLLEVLKTIKGKFILSLEGEIAKVIPKDFQVTKIAVPRQMALGPTGKLRDDPEILVSNFDLNHVEKSQPDSADIHVDKLLSEENVVDDDERLFVMAKSEDQHLVWSVNMIPNTVDGEGHWQTPETIMKVAHNFLLKDVPIWSEHQKAIPGVFPVQSYVLPYDWDFVDHQGNQRSLPEGTWVTVLWVQNDKVWKKIKSGEYVGTSVRGFARKKVGRPPPGERKEVGQ